MKKILLLILFTTFVFLINAQIMITSAQVNAINTAQSAASGDIYFDTDNNVYYIGLSSGLLKIIGNISKVDGSLSGDGSVANPLKVAQMGATTGQVLSWNGTTWVPVTAAPAVTTVTNTINSGQLITTVNGVNSTPVTLPSSTATMYMQNHTTTNVYGDGSIYNPFSVEAKGATTTTRGIIMLTGDLAGNDYWPVIGTGRVTHDKLADNSVYSNNILNGTILTEDLSWGAVTTEKLALYSVTYDRIQQMPAQTLLGNPYSSTGSPTAITLGTGLSFNGNILNASGSGWNLTGNSGTNPTNNFVGTTDAQRLAFRTSNSEKMTILTNGNVGINTTNPQNKLEITQGTAGNSGLRLTNLPNAGILATNSSGDVIIGTDIKDHHISRANSTSNFAPTSGEIPNPVNGNTAKVKLNNGIIEYWTYTSGAWTLNWSETQTVNGVDIGYIVGWTSNVTPPDYLLPLTGGTYNWSDFPHLQSFHSTFPCQYIASSNATTFTLVNINTNGRFLRGGLTAGTLQGYSTSLPLNPFILSSNTHSHTYTDYTVSGTNVGVRSGSNYYPINSLIDISNNYTSNSNTHTHTISGGDAETRPINASVVWCIKVKPTSTTGNITINNNTLSQTVTNLTQNTTTGEISYTNENNTNQTAQVVSSNANNSIQVGTDGGAYYQKDEIAIDIYNNLSSSQNITSSATTLVLNTIRVDLGSAFSLSSNQVKVNNEGIYRITYSAGLTNSAFTGEYTGEFWLERNGTTIHSSNLYINCYNFSIACGTRDIIIELSADDVIRIRMRTDTSNSVRTIPECSSINFEKIK